MACLIAPPLSPPSARHRRGRAEAGPYACSPLPCMDYRHHHLVSRHHHMVVEAASQRLGGSRHDESEEGDDVGNPYACSPLPCQQGVHTPRAGASSPLYPLLVVYHGIVPYNLYCVYCCLLGELGAAGLRVPPECVGTLEPDLGNASEGNACIIHC